MIFWRSLYIVEDVRSGDVVSSENVRSIRLGYDLELKHYEEVLGKTFKRDYSRGTSLAWENLNLE